MKKHLVIIVLSLLAFASSAYAAANSFELKVYKPQNPDYFDRNENVYEKLLFTRRTTEEIRRTKKNPL